MVPKVNSKHSLHNHCLDLLAIYFVTEGQREINLSEFVFSCHVSLKCCDLIQ